MSRRRRAPMKLRSPTKKAIVLPALHPNAGLRAAYQKQLDRLIDEMHVSLLYWLKASYRANAPEIAQDASPAMALRQAVQRLSSRWQKRFDDAAPELAKYFTKRAASTTDAALKGALKKAGFTVEFSMTKVTNDVMQATIGEQIGLIKSIASKHLADVQGMVMRSVSAGRDLGTLTQELEQRYAITKRRAAFIALDQNNKATASMMRVRQEALGLDEAKWLHSHGGKHPRKSHLAVDGKRYNVKKGMYIDGEYVWPGQKPGCRCISQCVIPGIDE
ncbi:phage minor head protein [Robbsia sp. KACC 23696]|uniref:phage head morphogenesis protein n=1 Tax=Robbsia sp. KACC 23696 TaxID=3149231 RepID=UPI00325BA23E